MTIKLSKDSVDIGIVTANGPAMLAFYRGTLGFADAGMLDLPGMAVHVSRCGTSTIKILVPDDPPAAVAALGGITGATGYRYCTISTTNIEEVVEVARRDGAKIVMEPSEAMPGVLVALVADPDGNMVELFTRRS